MNEYPEDARERRYISGRVMNEVKRRLAVIDMHELIVQDLRAVLLQLIAQDTKIDVDTETWGIDLDHGCVVREGPQNPEQAKPARKRRSTKGE
jgi:hypothetical protein